MMRDEQAVLRFFAPFRGRSREEIDDIKPSDEPGEVEISTAAGGGGGSTVTVVPYDSSKIYDISHADNNEHSVSLPGGLPASTKILFVSVIRVSGSGGLRLRVESGKASQQQGLYLGAYWFRALDGNFYYRQTVANDDYDVYLEGYITVS